MAPLAQPPSSGDSASSTNQYHTAYSGYATQHGRFTHFILKPDHSHLEFGFWCFAASQDEASAFKKGLHTPEDILIAVDAGEREEFEDINLLWIPGRVDPTLRSQISGSAAQHIRVIYNMRLFLRKPLSFGGRAPIYPMSQMLDEFWARRCIPALSIAEPRVAHALTRSQSSSLQNLDGSSSVAWPAVRLDQAAEVDPQAQVIHWRGSDCPSVRDDVGSNAPVPTQTSGTTGGRLSELDNGMPTSSDSITAPIPLPDSPYKNPTQGSLEKSHETSTGLPASIQMSPTAAVTQPYNDPGQATSSAENTYHHSSFGQDSSKPQATGMRHYTSRQNAHPSSIVPMWPAQAPQPPHPSPGRAQSLSLSQKSTIPEISSESGSTSGNQVVSRHGPLPNELSSTTPYVEEDPRPSTLQVEHQVGPQSLSVNEKSPLNTSLPTLNSAVSGHQQWHKPATDGDSRLIEPSKVASDTPIILSFDEEQAIMIAKERIINPPSNAFMPPKSPLATESTKSEAQLNSTRRSAELDFNEAQESKRQEVDEQHFDPPETIPGQATSPGLVTDSAVLRNTVHYMHAGLPCMDCDQDSGHRPGCYLDIAPMKNLTVLDYRNLADCVEHLDPGPWTTHQGPPPSPELEHPEAQIRKIAEIVRNEETYQSDSALHSLPDDFMILAWAWKTASNVEVITE